MFVSFRLIDLGSLLELSLPRELFVCLFWNKMRCFDYKKKTRKTELINFYLLIIVLRVHHLTTIKKII